MTHPLPGIWTPLWSGRRLWLKFLPMTRDFLKNIFFKKSIYIFIKKSRVIYIFMHKYICCFSAATHLFNIIWRKFIWMLVHVFLWVMATAVSKRDLSLRLLSMQGLHPTTNSPHTRAETKSIAKFGPLTHNKISGPLKQRLCRRASRRSCHVSRVQSQKKYFC